MAVSDAAKSIGAPIRRGATSPPARAAVRRVFVGARPCTESVDRRPAIRDATSKGWREGRQRFPLLRPDSPIHAAQGKEYALQEFRLPLFLASRPAEDCLRSPHGWSQPGVGGD